MPPRSESSAGATRPTTGFAACENTREAGRGVAVQRGRRRSAARPRGQLVRWRCTPQRPTARAGRAPAGSAAWPRRCSRRRCRRPPRPARSSTARASHVAQAGGARPRAAAQPPKGQDQAPRKKKRGAVGEAGQAAAPAWARRPGVGRRDPGRRSGPRPGRRRARGRGRRPGRGRRRRGRRRHRGRGRGRGRGAGRARHDRRAAPRRDRGGAAAAPGAVRPPPLAQSQAGRGERRCCRRCRRAGGRDR